MKQKDDPFIIQNQVSALKNGTLPNFSFNNYQGDTYFNNKTSSMWLGREVPSVKLHLIFAIILILFIGLLSRLGYLQLVEGENYYGIAEGNRLKTEFLPTDRGIIFDRWQTPLVNNVAAFSIYFYPQKFKDSAEAEKTLIQALTKIEANSQPSLLVTPAELIMSTSTSPILIKEKLTYEEALALMIVTKKFNCLEVIVDPYRDYSGDNINAHLLGYMSRISENEKAEYLHKGYQLFERIGRTGLEQYYEDKLRGEPGSRSIEVDSLGQEQKVVHEQPSVPGKNLILAIDNGLQEISYKALKTYQSDKAAAVIALDPSSGKVRALASWPSFDHNAFGQALAIEEYQAVVRNPLKPLFNRAIAGEYPSGSTIKIIIGSAALDEGLINRNTQVNSKGGIWYDQWFFPDWKAGGHGLTDINKAIAESVNTFFYYLALEEFDGHQGLGLNNILKYLSDAGLNNTLGIDLPGEQSGFLPSVNWKKEVKNEVWYPGDTLHLVIGQGDLLVTPLQVASYTAIVANGGTLFKPELLEKIVDPISGQVEIIAPQIIRRRVFTKASLGIIAEGMRSTVVRGSARSLAGNALAIAGKTGTAQIGGNQEPHAWFTSFAPYQNPELVLTILIENSQTSDNAVQIARDIWQWYYDNRR